MNKVYRTSFRIIFLDPNLLEKTEKIITTASIGREFGLKDIDGKLRVTRWIIPFVENFRLAYNSLPK